MTIGLPIGSQHYEKSTRARWYFLASFASIVMAALLTWAALSLSRQIWPLAAIVAFAVMMFLSSLKVFHLLWQEESVTPLGRVRDGIVRHDLKSTSLSEPHEAYVKLVLARTFLLLIALMALMGWLYPSWFYIPLVLIGVFSTELATIEYHRDVVSWKQGKVPWMLVWNAVVFLLFVAISAMLQDRGVAFSSKRPEFGIYALNIGGAFSSGAIGAYIVVGVKRGTRRMTNET